MSGLRLAAVGGVAIDPLIDACSPRSTAARIADSRKIIDRHNGDNARLERLVRGEPGPNARRFFGELNRIPPLVTGEHQYHVRPHPSTRSVQPVLPLYDQAVDRDGRIPQAIAMPIELLLCSVERPGSVGADALLAAAAAVREFNTPVVVPPVVGEGNSHVGVLR